MKVQIIDIPCNKLLSDDWFYVIPIGDTHVGNVGFDEKKLRNLVAWIKDKPNVYWLGMGDYIEAITSADKRFDLRSIAPEFQSPGKQTNLVPSQVAKFVEIMSPIKNQCIGLHEGNHDRKVRLKWQYDVVYEIWRAFDREDLAILQDSAITRLRFIYRGGYLKNPSFTFDIFSTHGNVGGRKGGGKINRLEDCIGFFDADIYLIAHSHIKATESKCIIYADIKGNLQRKKKILAVTGCFLNGYVEGGSSYVEQMMLPPTATGVVKLALNPRKKDIHISE